MCGIAISRAPETGLGSGILAFQAALTQVAISLLDSGGLSTPRYKNNTSSDNKDMEYKSAEKTLETAVATAKGHVTVEKSWYGGTPTEDVNAWTVWQHRTFLLSKPVGGCSYRVTMPAHRSRCLTRIRSPASPSVTVRNPVPDVYLANLFSLVPSPRFVCTQPLLWYDCGWG